MSDVSLTCKDCNCSFTFSEKSQAFYSEQGWADPVRCYDCRQAKKEKHANKQQKEYN